MKEVFSKLKSFIVKAKPDKLRETLATIIISVTISSFVTYTTDLKLEERVTNRKFIFDFSRVYFDNPKYRNISVAIEEQYLYGKEEKLASISDYDLDDYLGLISDMWSYQEGGYVSQDLINDQYGYYLCLTYNSKFVNDYRKRMLKIGFAEDENYTFLDLMAEKLKFKGKDCKGS